MSWFSNTSQIDQQIAEATSESLPSGEQNLALNLEISDVIRSKTVPPKDAMRSLKRRLLHTNPNVQLATLNLLDTCVKNGGTHFLIEIASREFMDTLVNIIIPISGSPNGEVKKLALELIQNWAIAFKSQLQLSYVDTVYKNLKEEGQPFPSPTVISQSFIDSSAPPEWTDSENCLKCNIQFSFVVRKHHCRNCGGVFCNNCSLNTLPLPRLGINVPVRVCDTCYKKLKRTEDSKSTTTFTTISAPNLASATTSDGHNVAEEDDELKRAIELSLKEAGLRVSKHITAAPIPSFTQPNLSSSSNATTDDDEDMKAAIEASLRDMGKPNKGGATDGAVSHLVNDYNNYHQGNENVPALTKKHDEILPVEEENIHLFSTLINRLETAPPGSILQEGKIQELYDNIGNLRPKLARTLGINVSKYDKLVNMHAKLSTVVRYYDKLLEDSLSMTYGKHTISNG
ncbi:VHS-domain-containing protein, partial [Nadsonia fulvescens var. elongata DSM 6958]